MDTKENDDMHSANFSWAVAGDLLTQFKAAKTGEDYQSDQFTAFDRVWRLDCYPNGKDQSSAGHISLYLRCVQQQQQHAQDVHDIHLAVQLRVVNADAVFTEYQKRFGSNGQCGSNQIAPLNLDWNTLTISAELLQTAYIDKGWFTWRLSSFVLDRFRTAPGNISTSYDSPKLAIYGQTMHITCYPKSTGCDKACAYIYIHRSGQGDLFFDTASVTLQCKQADYKYHTSYWETKGLLSPNCWFGHSVFINSDVVEIQFKLIHLIQIYPSYTVVTINREGIDTKPVRIRDPHSKPAWSLAVSSNEIKLYMSTKNDTGNIYTKLECGAFNLHDERVSVTAPTDESWRDELKTNSQIDVLHKKTANQPMMWYTAKIVDVDEVKNKLKVHYDGWPSDDDEWIEKHEDRIQPFRSVATGGLESGGIAADVANVGYQQIATFEYDRNSLQSKSEICIKLVVMIVPSFLLEQCVSLKRVRESTFGDSLYETHINTIAEWNEHTSTLQRLAACDEQSILHVQPADDEEKNEVVDKFASLLSKKYTNYIAMLQVQSSNRRIFVATDRSTKHHHS